MKLDSNDYYPFSNLARLYRTRNRKGGEDKAGELLVAGCNVSLKPITTTARGGLAPSDERNHARDGRLSPDGLTVLNCGDTVRNYGY
jgi:hypothetical protein